MKYLVIGSGASGIVSSIRLSRFGSVILLEKNDKIGKKILVTGNGRCNLWNTNLNTSTNLENYFYTDNYDKFNLIFKDKFSECYKYLTNDLNIYTRNKNGLIYPYSNTAFSVRELFEKELTTNPNIDIHLEEEALSIDKELNKYKVITNKSTYIVDKIVISCGSKSSDLGTDTLTNLLSKYDIKINKLMPSLVPIILDEDYLNNWNGIRVDAKLSLTSTIYNKEETGELQLTDYGISGIVTFNLSGYIAKLLDKKEKFNLSIDFMPELTSDELKIMFTKKYSNMNKSLERILETYFNYKLLFILLKKANLSRDITFKSLSDKEIDNLINTIKNFNVNVSDIASFKRSQVTRGGISLDEVDNNLMLKKLNNVYVAGEILDIDGICGGYNLGVSFTSGYIVGEYHD